MESHLFWLPVPRSNRNDNFIDKSFTVMADLIVKLLPINARAKEAYVYYRDGLSAQNDGDYAAALENYEESLKLEENAIDRGETLKNIAIIYMSNGEEERALETYQKALEGNPKQPSCLKNMGLIYEKRGRTAEEDGRLPKVCTLPRLLQSCRLAVAIGSQAGKDPSRVEMSTRR